VGQVIIAPETRRRPGLSVSLTPAPSRIGLGRYRPIRSASNQLFWTLPPTAASLTLLSAGGNAPLFSPAYWISPIVSWRMLLAHFTWLPLSRARERVGRRIEISRAMIPMTTSSSTSVNPLRLLIRDSP
jgi:hypothetical protein